MNGGDFRPGLLPGELDGIETGEALQKGFVFPFRGYPHGYIKRPIATTAQHVGDVSDFGRVGLFHDSQKSFC